MSAAEYEQLTTEPECRKHIVKFVGGTAAITKVFGKGMTTTYVSTGIVEIAWPDLASKPGAFVGCTGHCFEATTPGDLKGFTVVPGVYNATTKKLRVNIFNSTFNLADLAALNWLTLELCFKETGSNV